MAQTAATIDELSGGRLEPRPRRLAPAGGRGLVRPDDRQARRRDEGVRRRSSARSCAARTRRPGGKWRTGFRLVGHRTRPPTLPIYVAALSPAMLRAVGEIVDGVILWLCNPEYIRDVVVPEVATGRERAGKPLEGFDIVAAVPAACTDDRDAAYGAMRRDLLAYFGLPFYRAMIERSGFGDDIAAFDEAAGAATPRRCRPRSATRFLDVADRGRRRGPVRAGVRALPRRGRRRRRASARSPGPTSSRRCARPRRAPSRAGGRASGAGRRRPSSPGPRPCRPRA